MRNPTIDVLKALASQVIVVHHLLLYTPMSDALQAQWPTLLGILADEGRYVVQVFLVIGGYLAAQSLMRLLTHHANTPLIGLGWKRFLRLAKPFWAAMVCAVFCIWLAGRIAFDTETNTLPSLAQVLTHATLTYDIAGVPALSAGVWYVAIDLQLFLITLFLIHCARWAAERLGVSATRLVLGGVVLLTVLGLFWWNRNPALDEWGWYFIGSYGLGFMAHWAGKNGYRKQANVAIVLCLWACLLVEWRERLLLTGFVALLLLNHVQVSGFFARMATKPVQWLSDVSYSVFLIHYGVAVLASAVVIELNVQSLSGNMVAFVLTWAAGIAAGWLLHKGVESSS